MFSLFRRNPQQTKSTRRTPHSYRPRLEVLESRLCPSGGLFDPTFGSGGIVNLPNTTDSAATAVAVQPDGKVVIVGHMTRSLGDGQ